MKRTTMIAAALAAAPLPLATPSPLHRRFVAWDSPGAVADLCAALTGS
jgi:hypothetical protein